MTSDGGFRGASWGVLLSGKACEFGGGRWPQGEVSPSLHTRTPVVGVQWAQGTSAVGELSRGGGSGREARGPFSSVTGNARLREKPSASRRVRRVQRQLLSLAVLVHRRGQTQRGACLSFRWAEALSLQRGLRSAGKPPPRPPSPRSAGAPSRLRCLPLPRTDTVLLLGAEHLEEKLWKT